MHELSLVQGVLEQVHSLREAGVFTGRVVIVRLKVGRLAAALPDQLTFAFDVLSEGTDLAGARLEIEEVPIRTRCRTCGAEAEVDEPLFLCASCGSPDVEILSGRELMIDSLEVQDD